MNKRINFKVYEDNELIGNSYFIMKYEGHLEVVRKIYKSYGYDIEVIE